MCTNFLCILLFTPWNLLHYIKHMHTEWIKQFPSSYLICLMQWGIQQLEFVTLCVDLQPQPSNGNDINYVDRDIKQVEWSLNFAKFKAEILLKAEDKHLPAKNTSRLWTTDENQLKAIKNHETCAIVGWMNTHVTYTKKIITNTNLQLHLFHRRILYKLFWSSPFQTVL